MTLCHNPNFLSVGLGVGIFLGSDLQTDCLKHPLLMQLYEIISSEQSSVGKELQSLKTVIEKNQVWLPTDDVQFVFLCGANIKPDIPSKRRQILRDFSSRHLPYAKFFLAESMFQILESEGHKSNLLDIENELSKFSDYVIVVLESESAFCELGAFATHKELRKKLIIINDNKHQKSDSFINLGPLQAISEISDATCAELMLFDSMTNDVIAATKDERKPGLKEKFTKWWSAEDASNSERKGSLWS